MLTLALGFLLVALLYSLVGFAGGSSYTAFLALADYPYQDIVKISLICNIIVSTGGVFHFWKKNLLNQKLTTPFILLSVPFAFMGGYVNVAEKSFYLMLGLVLVCVGLRLLSKKAPSNNRTECPSVGISLVVGAILGALAGVVGIGGGIFLSPLIMSKSWGNVKEAASTASVFILLNSIAGLLGQVSKDSETEFFNQYFWLFIVVFLGGQLGSYLTTQKSFSDRYVKLGTAVLTLYVGTKVLVTKTYF